MNLAELLRCFILAIDWLLVAISFLLLVTVKERHQLRFYIIGIMIFFFNIITILQK